MTFRYLWKYSIRVTNRPPAHSDGDVLTFADMFAAMGAEPRLRIVRLLLEAHPEGLAAGDIGTELDIPASTLSHHLDRLKREEIVRVRREGTYLWYTANTEALEGLMRFLFSECCTRSGAISPARLNFVKPGARI